MSNLHSRAAAAYRTTQIESRSSLELVVLLYDGLVRHLAEARDALARKDLHAKRRAVTRALAILTHLQSTLNHKRGGVIASQLHALYTHITGLVTTGNIKGDPRAFEDAIALLQPLREAWTAVASAETARIPA